jgi:hypothetical protein
MLDVHPPHESAHSWKDFFIHIATIVVGLLIAVGLEQTVEAVHHRNQRAELRESLERESRQVLKDASDTAAAQDYQLGWLTDRREGVQLTVWSGEPLRPPSAHKLPNFAYPDDPLWRSAKTSGLVELLTPDEVNAYSEVELLAVKVDAYYDHWREAENRRLEFEREFPRLANGDPDFSKAASEDMRTYLSRLMAESGESMVFREWNRNLVGAEKTILSGDLKLEDIFAAEKQGRGEGELP